MAKPKPKSPSTETVVYFRLKEPVFQALLAKAEEDRRPVSVTVAILVEEYFKGRSDGQPTA